ncbi:homocysteine S-methyltransferase family protein [Roseobacter sp. YSTF-M11]|uniref:Homocysteine S-methyltransferase family protein n=1 Tax=Roseobacter insulae TaxID=2859783 RepID=A0A9X1FYK9_9RHOB|nr:homocysteine S-methyltransferase family protein [Roseobacter insulae]MBW4709998.1 homocysteine S-methyltransferase family protein [Roseobacter insulae]
MTHTTGYRAHLPQLDGALFLTDGGIETTLIFEDGFDLPHFAAFTLLNDTRGTGALKAYFQKYLNIAVQKDMGFILESPTWRASADWGKLLGFNEAQMSAANEDAIFLMRTLRNANSDATQPIVISGCIGPRGDGYDPGDVMTADAAQAYHSLQARAFAKAGADMITAITMTNTPEAIGLTRAAVAEGMPVVISFTVETDGKLPTGQPLGDAIEQVDAETGNAPAYYMINCAHPDHFEPTLRRGGDWLHRLKGLRANASRMSHAELDEAEELDAGQPDELGQDYRRLQSILPGLAVVGGCCGTDHRHVDCISSACTHKAHEPA